MVGFFERRRARRLQQEQEAEMRRERLDSAIRRVERLGEQSPEVIRQALERELRAAQIELPASEVEGIVRRLTGDEPIGAGGVSSSLDHSPLPSALQNQLDGLIRHFTPPGRGTVSHNTVSHTTVSQKMHVTFDGPGADVLQAFPDAVRRLSSTHRGRPVEEIAAQLHASVDPLGEAFGPLLDDVARAINRGDEVTVETRDDGFTISTTTHDDDIA